MDIVQDSALHLWDNYNWALTRGDKRVEDWLFMKAYWPTLTLTGIYLFCVWIGPKLMQNREPFKLKYPIVLYNLVLVLINFHICFELFTATWSLNYSYSCQKVDYSDNPDEIRIAKALWWYYFSKLVEFLDTIFFILRKKNNQVSFLHVYHHATMFPIWWIGVKWVAGGQSFFGAMINSGIHVLMYTYYGIAALGPEFQKYLWWKRYLTRIQLVQFIAGMSHALQSIIVRCEYPLWMQWALVIYGGTILGLFLNFYFHAYVKQSKPKSKGKESTNGHVSNGHPPANGVKESKKRK